MDHHTFYHLAINRLTMYLYQMMKLCGLFVQLRGNRGLLVAGTKNVENYYPNSMATYVNGQLWQKLLGRFVNV